MSTFTGLKFERVEGVLGQFVSEKTFPPGAKDGLATDGQRGSWRGHLNAIERVVAEGWGSALILEDDVDWDIRLKDQMFNLSQSLQLLHEAGPKAEGDLDLRLHHTEPVAAGNPYGDDWDVLWIGHCGTQWPNKKIFKHLPQARAVLLDDPTVPQTQHIQWEWGSKYLGEHYPNHTRVYHHTADVLCSLGYAITQDAARQLLWQMSLKETTDPFDIALRQYCDGHGDRPLRRCFTTQPTLFDHHRPVGFASRVSDISNNGNEEKDWRDTAMTANIRQAVRVNLNRLVNGETELLDQWPDQE
jgi:GR25 family glycosyltransferase involved in LPS biosynthesis